MFCIGVHIEVHLRGASYILDMNISYGRHEAGGAGGCAGGAPGGQQEQQEEEEEEEEHPWHAVTELVKRGACVCVS